MFLVLKTSGRMPKEFGNLEFEKNFFFFFEKILCGITVKCSNSKRKIKNQQHGTVCSRLTVFGLKPFLALFSISLTDRTKMFPYEEIIYLLVHIVKVKLRWEVMSWLIWKLKKNFVIRLIKEIKKHMGGYTEKCGRK